jgi:type I restriction enzyme M protein
MFEQAFKNIEDVRRKAAGCTTELDYTEQFALLARAADARGR